MSINRKIIYQTARLMQELSTSLQVVTNIDSPYHEREMPGQLNELKKKLDLIYGRNWLEDWKD
jgi:hypothetical protein